MNKILTPPLPQPSCEQIIDILPNPFVVIDEGYRIVSANIAYCRRYDLQREDVVGRLCHEVSHNFAEPCSRHGEHCPLEMVFATDQPTQVMHIHCVPCGGEEMVQIHASPIPDQDGRTRYMAESIHPMPRQQCEDALIVGRSPALMRMLGVLQRVAPTSTTVLLQGESGSGKECAAQYLHACSGRPDAPFVIVDCAALGGSLIESELFGYEKGAFTGAASRKKGLFEAAHGGTLFIDEIGELPLSLQTKLLRVLETGSIRRIGGTDYIPIDVRIIAATHRDLQQQAATGQFRQDLYYRLSAFPVRIPPLRERREDIPVLAEYFLQRVEDGEKHLPLSPDAVATLLNHDYPGNVRELRQVVERASILAIDDVIRPDHIVIENAPDEAGSLPNRGQLDSRKTPGETEIHAALAVHGGHRGRAAQALGISERTLYRHIRRLRQA